MESFPGIEIIQLIFFFSFIKFIFAIKEEYVAWYIIKYINQNTNYANYFGLFNKFHKQNEQYARRHYCRWQCDNSLN